MREEFNKYFTVELCDYHRDANRMKLLIVDEADEYASLYVEGEEALNRLIKQLESFRGKMS